MNRLQKPLECLLSKLNVTSRLALNNIALRQQLIVLKHGCNKPPILNKDRLSWMRILKNYFEYYHQDRTHLGLEKDTPVIRAIQSKPTGGVLIKLPRVGGLHHRYMWKKAA